MSSTQITAEQVETARTALRRASNVLDDALTARARVEVLIRKAGVTPALAARIDSIGQRIALAEIAYRTAARRYEDLKTAAGR